ncbi:futalosine hydrolase [Paenibacillus doosanensis]|uniref:futalosine hydrolase n=1 Tax=Paenibacillus doosanensis TaxID=1229154 RepID=UPI002180941A|nr:futalosine hydrolase [Paenibacillus doosanensis]MCS7463357.1 futalosine hydrolase [Paenibacillus doosanensis]
MNTQTQFRVLVATAVEAEKEAVLRGLGNDPRFDVIAAGVGPVAAAVGATKALAAAPYGLVVIAGIAGGFAEQAAIGSLVVASEIIAADLGAETPDGFCSLDELGFGSARIAVDLARAERLAEALAAAGLSARLGPVLTLSTVTGTAETSAALAKRVPGAAAEAMEGFGIAAAALYRGVPVLELRAVSNAVGPRDRAAWRIGDALQALQSASKVLQEVL